MPRAQPDHPPSRPARANANAVLHGTQHTLAELTLVCSARLGTGPARPPCACTTRAILASPRRHVAASLRAAGPAVSRLLPTVPLSSRVFKTGSPGGRGRGHAAAPQPVRPRPPLHPVRHRVPARSVHHTCRQSRAPRLAHRCRPCAGPTAANISPGPPMPHLHRDRAHRCHICTGTGARPCRQPYLVPFCARACACVRHLCVHHRWLRLPCRTSLSANAASLLAGAREVAAAGDGRGGAGGRRGNGSAEYRARLGRGQDGAQQRRYGAWCLPACCMINSRRRTHQACCPGWTGWTGGPAVGWRRRTRCACHVCTGTGARPCHICAGTGLTAATSAPGPGCSYGRVRR